MDENITCYMNEKTYLQNFCVFCSHFESLAAKDYSGSIFFLLSVASYKRVNFRGKWKLYEYFRL